MRARTGIALLVPLLAGCAAMQPPQGYAVLPAGGDLVFAAVSPAGNRLVVRRHENPEGGTLGFWTEAIRRELVEGRGYRLVGTRELEAGGEPGAELLFELEKPSGAWSYLVAVFLRAGFLRSSAVVVAEAGGESGSFREDLPKVRASLATLR
jgi:hypothetical protein